MSVTDLKAACIEIVNEIQTIPGIRSAPEEPPESTELYPFVVTYPGTGTYHQGPAVVLTGLHDITIELHVARRDLPRNYTTVLDLIDQIPYELQKLLNAGGYSTIKTFGDIEYTFGAMSWGGVDTIGVRYTITQVKTQTGLI